MSRRAFRLSFLVLSLGLLASAASGCATAVVGAGAGVGVAAVQERGLKGGAKDLAIRARINDLWFRHDAEMFRQVNLEVVEGRVLLTGKVASPDMRVDAVRLAWQADGVREVINEIEVSESGGLIQWSRDRWISAQLHTALTLDQQVYAINYTVETVNGTVYLMGIAQNQAELDRVINHARDISYVQRVVSHVRLKNDPNR